MLFSELPSAENHVLSAREGDLVDAISTLMGSEARFASMDIAYEGPGSCRVFFLEPSTRGVPCPPQTSVAVTIGAELIRYSNQPYDQGGARYPKELPEGSGGWLKGWSIRKVEIDGEPALVAEAGWVKELL